MNNLVLDVTVPVVQIAAPLIACTSAHIFEVHETHPFVSALPLGASLTRWV